MPAHCSFDFWDTIARSNPDFKQQRNALLANHFTVSAETVAAVFSEVGRKYNRMQEKSTGHYDAKILLCKVIEGLGYRESYQRVTYLFDTVMELFYENQPRIRPDVAAAIAHCKLLGVSMSIISNTAFIPGSQVKRFLDETFGHETFPIQLYSDELGMAKPNKSIFYRAHALVCEYYSTSIAMCNMLHVGDNPINDYKAAQSLGMDAYAIQD
jgi:putative hydrolase of the HAD superfamily